MFGLGVWQVPNGSECEHALRSALSSGTAISTPRRPMATKRASAALRDSGVPRNKVFVTTKFFPEHRSPEAEARRSLERLGVEQVDLYIVQWPRRPEMRVVGRRGGGGGGCGRWSGVSILGARQLEQRC